MIHPKSRIEYANPGLTKTGETPWKGWNWISNAITQGSNKKRGKQQTNLRVAGNGTQIAQPSARYRCQGRQVAPQSLKCWNTQGKIGSPSAISIANAAASATAASRYRNRGHARFPQKRGFTPRSALISSSFVYVRGHMQCGSRTFQCSSCSVVYRTTDAR